MILDTIKCSLVGSGECKVLFVGHSGFADLVSFNPVELTWTHLESFVSKDKLTRYLVCYLEHLCCDLETFIVAKCLMVQFIMAVRTALESGASGGCLPGTCSQEGEC